MKLPCGMQAEPHSTTSHGIAKKYISFSHEQVSGLEPKVAVGDFNTESALQ